MFGLQYISWSSFLITVTIIFILYNIGVLFYFRFLKKEAQKTTPVSISNIDIHLTTTEDTEEEIYNTVFFDNEEPEEEIHNLKKNEDISSEDEIDFPELIEIEEPSETEIQSYEDIKQNKINNKETDTLNSFSKEFNVSDKIQENEKFEKINRINHNFDVIIKEKQNNIDCIENISTFVNEKTEEKPFINITIADPSQDLPFHYEGGIEANTFLKHFQDIESATDTYAVKVITCEEEELPVEEQKKLKRSERAITKINNEPSDELKELYKKTDMTFRNFHENEE